MPLTSASLSSLLCFHSSLCTRGISVRNRFRPGLLSWGEFLFLISVSEALFTTLLRDARVFTYKICVQEYEEDMLERDSHLLGVIMHFPFSNKLFSQLLSLELLLATLPKDHETSAWGGIALGLLTGALFYTGVLVSYQLPARFNTSELLPATLTGHHELSGNFLSKLTMCIFSNKMKGRGSEAS